MVQSLLRVAGLRRGGIATMLMALLFMSACVGRPQEVRGQHASFLPRANGAPPGAVPTNVGGTSDTSGLGAGMLVSPGSAPEATPTPQK